MQMQSASKHTDSTLEKDFITSVYIEKNGDRRFHPFYCSDCRNIVCKHNGEVVMIAPGMSVQNLPTVVVECSNANCRRRYQFVASVEVS